MASLERKNFKTEADEVSTPNNARVETVNVLGQRVMKLTVQPGWKWSEDVSPLSGTKFCEVEHLGMVLSGSATVDFKDGKVHTINKGDIFYVSSRPHDSWVVGLENYISIHFLGADKYADK